MAGQASNRPSVGDWSLANQHLLNTVRILVRGRDGAHSVGTGFMHKFCGSGDEAIQCVVTNRHVIAGSVSCELVFRSQRVDAADAPIVASTIRFDLGFEERWYKHPDERVDLAALPLSNEFRQMLGNGFTPLYKATQLSQLVTAEAAAELNAVEEILMVGYPDGLWDQANNLPVARRGITATPVSVEWNGRNEFLIDCSVYPGSSGSPVYLFSPSGTRLSVEHRLIPTNQVMLLGVVKSVFVHTVGGEVEVSPAPTASGEWRIAIPNDLGLCTRADELLYFERHFRKVMAGKGLGNSDTGHVVAGWWWV